MIAWLGSANHKLSIDIGFGDYVTPIRQSIPLLREAKRALFEENVSLLCYPQEFIFAEKLETVIHRGSSNSRMKDFHDLYLLIQSEDTTSFPQIEKVIRAVFHHRGTPASFPIVYPASQWPQLRSLWTSYLRLFRDPVVPKDFDEVIRYLNEWLSTKNLIQ